ncbi:tetratricopeptide repeat protein [Spirillospora sp. NBC_00431]
MEFRILGPVEVWSDGQRQHLGWAKERRLLAVLLMAPGRPVVTDVLIDHVWDGDAPAKARELLHPHITRIRRILQSLSGEARLTQEAGTYVLQVDPETIDYHRFRSLRDQARAIADSGLPDEAVRLLNDALRLWRGDPLANIEGRWAAGRRRGMQEEWLGAAIDRARLKLDQGENAALIPDLNELIDRFPDNEKPVELLMLALHRSGRSGEALRVYERSRQRLDAELGVLPHPELRELHRRILAGDPELTPSPRSTRAVPPSDLPHDLHTFTGRDTEIAQLATMAGDTGSTLTVLAIDGMPGVGKSTLAIHFAHQLASRYPDGRIYINLRSHDSGHKPLGPASALDRLLRAMGVAPSRIPPDIDGRAALWRTELAGRRVLLLLDNARGHEQIRPLLPGGPGCLVLITSRRRLAGLDGARTLQLNVLAPVDAARLLIRSAELGRDADPVSTQTVVQLCGYLPLAVQLIGNRLRHRTSWTVRDLAERLGGGGGPLLAEIRAENRGLSAAFELSYLDLDEDARRALRLLGLHPGVELTAPDAAVLLDAEPTGAEILLDALHDHHLIDETQPGRYRFHDLIREYARQLVADHDPPPVREGAVDRLLNRYLSLVSHADRLLFPYRLRPAPLPSSPSPFSDEDHARAWMAAELDNALYVFHQAAETGRSRHAGLLANALGEYLETQGRWPEASAVHEHAVRAWRSLRDDEETAFALAAMSRILLRTGKHEQALDAANQGLGIAREAGVPSAVATLLDQLGLIHWQLSDFDVAIGYYEHALEIRRAAGDRAGEAEVLHHRAISHWHLGRYAEAAEGTRTALSLYELTGNRRGRQMTLNNLGDLALILGDSNSALRHYEEAAGVMPMGRQHFATWLNNIATARLKSGHPASGIGQYREALSIYQEIGDRRGEAACLNNIGRWYVETGREGEALIHFQKALSMSREISERFEATAALLNIADANRRAGRHRMALDHYGEALSEARAIGDAYQEARALDGMAQVVARTQGQAHAAPLDEQALHIFRGLGVPEAKAVHARLQNRDSAAGT